MSKHKLFRLLCSSWHISYLKFTSVETRQFEGMHYNTRKLSNHCCNCQNVYVIITNLTDLDIKCNSLYYFIYTLNLQGMITHSLFFQDLKNCIGIMIEWWVKMQATLNTGHGKFRKLDRLQGDCLSIKQFRVYTEQHRIPSWSYGICAGACRWICVPLRII